jgi:siroheme synthase
LKFPRLMALGNVNLLTIQARDEILASDTVVADSSVSPHFLDDLRKILNGASRKSIMIIKPTSTKTRHEAVMSLVRDGRRVARLVCGDPLFFSTRIRKVFPTSSNELGN